MIIGDDNELFRDLRAWRCLYDLVLNLTRINEILTLASYSVGILLFMCHCLDLITTVDQGRSSLCLSLIDKASFKLNRLLYRLLGNLLSRITSEFGGQEVVRACLSASFVKMIQFGLD